MFTSKGLNLTLMFGFVSEGKKVPSDYNVCFCVSG